MFFTPQALHQVLTQHNAPLHLWVAYSGGLDSHVLLHALAELKMDLPNMQLQAIHIHHGLSPHATTWVEHCQQVCDALDVRLVVRHIDPTVYDHSGSIEATARRYRYQIFEALLTEGEYLLTAHHRDDQAETVLLRLLRGSGPKGLAAMRLQRPLGKGVLARPLLGFSRAELAAYAKNTRLVWIEDESNIAIKIDRNYLRHQIFPLLTAHWPQAAQVLSRTAQHCLEADQLLEEVANEDAIRVQGSVVETLSLAKLRQLAPGRQKNVVRFWLSRLGFSLPSTKKLDRLLQDCVYAKESAMPLLQWEGVEVRCFAGNLYAMLPLPAHDATQVIACEASVVYPSPLKFWSCSQGGSLSSHMSEYVSGTYSLNAYPVPVNVMGIEGIPVPLSKKATIRFRRGGELFHPRGRVGSHPLKKLFQEWGVPPWLRDRVPLIYFDEELVVVVGYAVSEKY